MRIYFFLAVSFISLYSLSLSFSSVLGFCFFVILTAFFKKGYTTNVIFILVFAFDDNKPLFAAHPPELKCYYHRENFCIEIEVAEKNTCKHFLSIFTKTINFFPIASTFFALYFTYIRFHWFIPKSLNFVDSVFHIVF